MEGSPDCGYTFDTQLKRGRCHVCAIELTSVQHAASHVEGKKHKKTLQNSSLDFNRTIERTWENYCETCQVSFSGIQNAKQHFDSERHMKKVTQAENSRNMRNRKLRSPIINTTSSDQNVSYDSAKSQVSGKVFTHENVEHLHDTSDQQLENVEKEDVESSTHYSTVLDTSSAETGLGYLKLQMKSRLEKLKKDANPQEYCVTCDVPFSSPGNAVEHYKGRRHKKNVEKQQIIALFDKAARAMESEFTHGDFEEKSCGNAGDQPSRTHRQEENAEGKMDFSSEGVNTVQVEELHVDAGTERQPENILSDADLVTDSRSLSPGAPHEQTEKGNRKIYSYTWNNSVPGDKEKTVDKVNTLTDDYRLVRVNEPVRPTSAQNRSVLDDSDSVNSADSSTDSGFCENYQPVIDAKGKALSSVAESALEQTDPDRACAVCNVTFSSPDNARDHYLGKKHKKKIEKQRIIKLFYSTPGSPNGARDGLSDSHALNPRGSSSEDVDVTMNALTSRHGLSSFKGICQSCGSNNVCLSGGTGSQLVGKVLNGMDFSVSGHHADNNPIVLYNQPCQTTGSPALAWHESRVSSFYVTRPQLSNASSVYLPSKCIRDFFPPTATGDESQNDIIRPILPARQDCLDDFSLYPQSPETSTMETILRDMQHLTFSEANTGQTPGLPGLPQCLEFHGTGVNSVTNTGEATHIHQFSDTCVMNGQPAHLPHYSRTDCKNQSEIFIPMTTTTSPLSVTTGLVVTSTDVSNPSMSMASPKSVCENSPVLQMLPPVSVPCDVTMSSAEKLDGSNVSPVIGGRRSPESTPCCKGDSVGQSGECLVWDRLCHLDHDML